MIYWKFNENTLKWEKNKRKTKLFWGVIITFIIGSFIGGRFAKVEALDNFERDIYQQVDLTNQNLDKKENELIRYTDELHSKHENDLNELYRYVDSRTDKLEAKFSNQLSSGVEVKNALDKINKVEADLDDFVKMYRNQ